jgi:hypothetical protein
MTDEELMEIKVLIAAATPEPLRRNLYDHGGGRMFRDGKSGERELVLDAYGQADRDFYFSARINMITLVQEVERQRAALAAAPRWVPMTERLPRPRDAEDYFLARLENGTRVEAMHNGTSWWEFDHELEDWIPLVGVTHWYQVPAPEAIS